jgi:hypothetical protein
VLWVCLSSVQHWTVYVVGMVFSLAVNLVIRAYEPSLVFI